MLASADVDSLVQATAVHVLIKHIQIENDGGKFNCVGAVHSTDVSIVELEPVGETDNTSPNAITGARLVLSRKEIVNESQFPRCISIAIRRGCKAFAIEFRDEAAPWSKTEERICMDPRPIMDQVDEEEGAHAEAQLDLERILRPLDRDQLEEVVARMIGTAPWTISVVVDFLRRPINKQEFADEVALLLDGSIEALISKIEQCCGFLDVNALENATSFLELITQAIVDRVLSSASTPIGIKREESLGAKRVHRDVADDVSSTKLDEVWPTLEQIWRDLVLHEDLPHSERKRLFKELAHWRHGLCDAYGPIFSDVLRALKLKIESNRDERRNPKTTSSSE